MATPTSQCDLASENGEVFRWLTPDAVAARWQNPTQPAEGILSTYRGTIDPTDIQPAIKGSPYSTSSVTTLKLTSVFGPNALLIGTSTASRPRAINTRPYSGLLLRGSNVCHAPSR